MFDPDSHLPRPNRNLIYFGGCIIVGMRLARQTKVDVRVIPISVAVGESIELSKATRSVADSPISREARLREHRTTRRLNRSFTLNAALT
jgi:hypothetical protein